MIRVCPHSDTVCRHGMGCTFSCATDDYNGTKVPLAKTLATPDLRTLADALVTACEPFERAWNSYENVPSDFDLVVTPNLRRDNFRTLASAVSAWRKAMGDRL